MSEYISKESIVTLLEQYGYIDKEMERDLASIPSADVRPNIHGHWILDVYDNSVTCDKCGCCIYLDDIMNGDGYFCPNCGADMGEPKDIIHKAIDNTTFAEEAYPNIKEELHKAVDMAEPKGEKGTE